jgi:hypothetical protein
MADDEQADRFTLGLLVDLRDLCKEIGNEHLRFSSELHDLLRQVANPNVHGLDKDLTFKVQELALGPESFPETLRTISLNGNIEVARGAYSAAIRCYPKRRWLLLWGSYIVDQYDPKEDDGGASIQTG